MQNGESIKVWDVGVRTFHWSLVILFFVSYLTGEDGNFVHVYAGYGVLGSVVFRVLWGFVGTKYARFTDFIYGPKATFSYISSLISMKPIHYLGHNPLGGWVVVLMLMLLLLVTWSGLELYGTEGRGPLAGGDGSAMSTARASENEREDAGDIDTEESKDEGSWEEVHEVLSSITLALVFLHIAGVLVSSVIHRENLVKAMIRGNKRKPPEQ